MQYKFALFKPSLKNKYPTIVKWIILNIVLIILTTLNNLKFLLIKVLLCLTIILTIFVLHYLITNHKRFYFTKGSFIGYITFKNSHLNWQNQEINYQEIDSIIFINHDYLGKLKKQNILKPMVSIGVDNHITINLKNKQKLHSQFQMKHDHELFKVYKTLNINKVKFKWYY